MERGERGRRDGGDRSRDPVRPVLYRIVLYFQKIRSLMCLIFQISIKVTVPFYKYSQKSEENNFSDKKLSSDKKVCIFRMFTID